MSDIAPHDDHRTWLHRWLQRDPGTVPESVLNTSGCSRYDKVDSTCGGLAVLLGFVMALVAFSCGLFTQETANVVVLAIAFAIITIWCSVDYFAIEPCRLVERKARAIARRRNADVESGTSSVSREG